MGKGGKGVFGYLDDGGLAPEGIGTLGYYNLGVAGIGGVVRALGKVELLPVGRDAAGAFVVFGIEASAYGFRLAPLAFIVLLGEEYVCGLHACDAAQLVAVGIVARGGEVEVFVGLATETRGVFTSA